MKTLSRRTALAAVPLLAAATTMAGTARASASPTAVSPRIAELLRHRDAAYAEYRRLSDLGRSDDETNVPFNQWLDVSEEIVSIRAETFGDVLAQHHVIMHYYNLDGAGLDMGDAEERWVIGLGDSIRRLAGVS